MPNICSDGDPVEADNLFRPKGEDDEGKLPPLGPQVFFRAAAVESINYSHVKKHQGEL